MEEIDLKELIQMFLEKKFLIILIVIIFALLGAIYTLKFITPKYQSSTSLVLVQTGSENGSTAGTEYSNSITTSDITLNSNLVDNYISIAKSKVVANTVISNLNLDMTLEQFQDSISVTSASDTEIIEITVENINPNEACEIAKELADVFKEKVNEIYKVSNVHVLDVAEVPEKPSNINLVKNIIIFAFVGAILVSGYILLVNMLDTTIKTDTDIEKSLNLPVLASIVYTGESSKKKNKKVKDTMSTDSGIPYSDNVQFFYENTTMQEKANDSEESLNSFSYINQKALNKKNNVSKNRNKQRKGGKK